MESHDNFAYLLPFIFFVFGCTFLFLRRWGSDSAHHWGIGYIAAALGFASPLLLSELPVEARAIISNALFFAAFFFYGEALYSRFRILPAFNARIFFCAVAMAGIAYLVVVAHDLKGELIVSDLGCAILLLIPLWQTRGHLSRPVDRVLIGMVGLVVVETLVRVSSLIVFASGDAYSSLDDFLSSDYAFVMQVGASILGFLLALTVLGIVMLDVVGQHRHAAEHDPLTDLLNRRGFERATPDFARDAFPSGAVLVCDIDHFKLVNDLFGHAAGDSVIVGLAKVLRDGLPKEALAARFGGEEFVAFLPGVTLAEAGVLANAIRLTFGARNWREGGIDQQVTASFGVSSTARGDHSMHDAIGRADACLYAAKAGGRNQVVTEGSQPANMPRHLRVISVA
ncbi:GGDEF domain-containing protein [Rhizobium terrae]|uniref:GGDEF domain-containing protein n=1 Tax=Rhizobium terrae TaxID=2171756 RepID=UPI000E3C6278|nr:GGDEF domain-containing protein [Rhizobium terrae]